MKRKELKIKKVSPVYNRLVTTADRYGIEDSFTEGGILTKNLEGIIKEVQRVVAVKEGYVDIKVGDLVLLTFNKYLVKQYGDSIKEDMMETHKQVETFKIPQITLDGKNCLLLYTNDVEFVIEDYEEIEHEVQQLFVENKPKIIV